MTEAAIRFDDGAAYDGYMGRWSRLAGTQFLDWLAPAPRLRWLDVGCGNGAFTELLVERCAPIEVRGIDPSEAQLEFARATHSAGVAQFQQGDAQAMPYPDQAFDAAVMALVIFFLPEPARGVAEMARVVRPGGSVSAYAWDILGGGFPYAAMAQEMRELGAAPSLPPSVASAGLDALVALWSGAGLEAVGTHEITVERTYADFESFWTTALTGPSIMPKIALMSTADVAVLKVRLRERLAADAAGRITYGARANAVRGRVPG